MKRSLLVVAALFASGSARLVLRERTAEQSVLAEQSESALAATERMVASRMSTSVVNKEVIHTNAYVSTVMAALRTAAQVLEVSFNEAKPVDTKKADAHGTDTRLEKGAVPGGFHLTAGAKAQLKEQQDALEHLFTKLKKGIMEVNKQEKDNKDDVAKLMAEAEEKVKQDHDKQQNKKLSTWQREALENRTRTDENQLKYWKRGRELQHSMFHSNLKVAHGLMSRVKSVLAVYGHAMEHGQLDAKARAEIKRSLASMPRALLQTHMRQRRLRRALRRHRGRAAEWYEQWISGHSGTGRRLFGTRAA